MTILVVGATGTLGRQIVKQMLKAGYPVRCFVRNVRKAAFLREWGAELVYGDLKLPETIPLTLAGVTTVIDAATLRPGEEIATLQEIDLIGKIALIKAAKIANVDKFIFFSIKDNEKYQSIPLMRLKKKVEDTLIESKIPYTIFQMSGFYQGLIAQYAIPILEQQTIYTTQESASISYLDTRDVAKLCTRMLIIDTKLKTKKNTIIRLEGLKKWSSSEIIKICETMSGQSAKISYTSLNLLSMVKKIMGLSKWTWDIQDRLAFSEILLTKVNIKEKKKIDSLSPTPYTSLIFNDAKMTKLENYLQDYFENILKKLRDLNYDQSQVSKRKDLTF